MAKTYYIRKNNLQTERAISTPESFMKNPEIQVLKKSDAEKEIEETNLIIFDMLSQCCGDEEENEIDDRCMSCFEHACEYLEKQGWLENINDRMYKVNKSKLKGDG